MNADIQAVLAGESVGHIICADWLDGLRELPDGCVHCVVTSPPYWGLRNYNVAGQLGLEKTPDEYIAKMVAGFREVRRVLRDDGIAFVNLGDSYWNGGAEKRDGGHGFVDGGKKKLEAAKGALLQSRSSTSFGLKPKDLCGIPWRVALALQADGWWLRQDIIWAKPNPMPESVTDRCTKAHEYLFLLTKSPRYYWDAEAVKEEAKDAESYTGRKFRGPKATIAAGARPGSQQTLDKGCPGDGKTFAVVNKRSVWTIPTSPFSAAHFATFPMKLVEPCVKAGTSDRGCCGACGKPWKRVVAIRDPEKRLGKGYHDHEDDLGRGQRGVFPAKGAPTRETLGWQPQCKCGGEPVACLCLDPFMGAGTVGLVANNLGRRWLGIELNPEYIEMALKRIHGPLFAGKDK